MIRCPNCGTENDDGNVSCAGCFRSLTAATAPGPRETTYVPDSHRPNGLMFMLLGIGAFLLAGIVALMGALKETAAYPGAEPNLNAVAWRAWLFALSGDLLWVGLFMLLTGWIIRAIWYLPGHDSKPPP